MKKTKDVKRIINLIIGPLLPVMSVIFISNNIFSSIEIRAAVGTVAWMVYWWLTAPVDYAVTAFVPIIMNALVPMVPMNLIIQNYSSEIVMLLLGASILTVSWEITGLDKRISARFLKMIGPTLKSQIAFWFLLSTVLSMMLPNAIVVATITPVAVSMLKYVGEGDIEKSKIGCIILMAIAWGAGIGGIATPLGGSMNLVTIDYLQQLTGKEYLYIDWIIKFAPVTVFLIGVTITTLLILSPKNTNIKGTKQFFHDLYEKFPPMKKNEYICLYLFLIASGLSFTRQLYAELLPGLKPAYIFIIAGITTFILTEETGNRLMTWKVTQKKIIWELIFIFAGGLAAGALINNSGAAGEIGKYVSSLGLTGGYMTILTILAVTMILADLSSNTASAAISIPLVISIVQGLGLNAIPYVYIASIGVNIAYSMPTSIRAIPIGYGLPPKYMFKRGIGLTIVIIPILALLGYVLMKLWPAFSIA